MQLISRLSNSGRCQPKHPSCSLVKLHSLDKEEMMCLWLLMVNTQQQSKGGHNSSPCIIMQGQKNLTCRAEAKHCQNKIETFRSCTCPSPVFSPGIAQGSKKCHYYHYKQSSKPTHWQQLDDHGFLPLESCHLGITLLLVLMEELSVVYCLLQKHMND